MWCPLSLTSQHGMQIFMLCQYFCQIKLADILLANNPPVASPSQFQYAVSTHVHSSPASETHCASISSQAGQRLCRLVPHSSSATPLPVWPGQVPGHSQCAAALCLCSVLESQLPELATCAEEVTLKHLLWTSLQSWGEVTQELSRTEFSQVDAEKLEAVVGQYARTALKIEKGLSPNQVRNHTLDPLVQLSLSSSSCAKDHMNCLQPKNY